MNARLNAQLNRLARLFANARDRERSADALNAWAAARESMVALQGSAEVAPRLQRIGACLASCESVVRCWATVGFQDSFRLAGTILEDAIA